MFSIYPTPGRWNHVKIRQRIAVRGGVMAGVMATWSFLSPPLWLTEHTESFRMPLSSCPQYTVGASDCSPHRLLPSVCASSAAGSAYCLLASHRTWSSLQRCWSEQMFLPSLAHRLWRLTLQVLARYSVFVGEVRAGVLGRHQHRWQ